MQVDINGLRINLARSFNDLCHTLDVDALNADQYQALQDLRQNIAFLLLVHDKSIEMKELIPDQYLMKVAENDCL